MCPHRTLLTMTTFWLQVTSTPYSSHENLNCSDADMPDLSPAEVRVEDNLIKSLESPHSVFIILLAFHLFSSWTPLWIIVHALWKDWLSLKEFDLFFLRDPFPYLHIELPPTSIISNPSAKPYLITPPQAPLGPPLPCSTSPVATAEAPELSYGDVFMFYKWHLLALRCWQTQNDHDWMTLWWWQTR